jgi:hypothetical protein
MCEVFMKTVARRNSDSFTGGNGESTRTQKVPPRRTPVHVTGDESIEELDLVVSKHFPTEVPDFWRASGPKNFAAGSKVLATEYPALFSKWCLKLDITTTERAQLIYDFIGKTSNAALIDLDNLPMVLSWFSEGPITRKDFLKRLIQESPIRTVNNRIAFDHIREEIPEDELTELLSSTIELSDRIEHTAIVPVFQLIRASRSDAPVRTSLWMALAKHAPEETYTNILNNTHKVASGDIEEVLTRCAASSAKIALVELERIANTDNPLENTALYTEQITYFAATRDSATALRLVLGSSTLQNELMRLINIISETNDGPQSILTLWKSIYHKVPPSEIDTFFLKVAAKAPQCVVPVLKSPISPPVTQQWAATFCAEVAQSAPDDFEILGNIGAHLLDLDEPTGRRVLGALLERGYIGFLNQPINVEENEHLLKMVLTSIEKFPTLKDRLYEECAPFVRRILAAYSETNHQQNHALQHIGRIFITKALQKNDTEVLSAIVHPEKQPWFCKELYLEIIEDESTATYLALMNPRLVLNFLIRTNIENTTQHEEYQNYAAKLSRVFIAKLSFPSKLSLYEKIKGGGRVSWRILLDDPYSYLTDNESQRELFKYYPDLLTALPYDSRRAEVLANALIQSRYVESTLKLFQSMVEPIGSIEMIKIFTTWSKQGELLPHLPIKTVLNWLKSNTYEQAFLIIHKEIGAQLASSPTALCHSEYLREPQDHRERLRILRDSVGIKTSEVATFLENFASLLGDGDALNIAIHFINEQANGECDQKTFLEKCIQLHRGLITHEDRQRFTSEILARRSFDELLSEKREFEKVPGYYSFIASLARSALGVEQIAGMISIALRKRQFKTAVAMISTVDKSADVLNKLLDRILTAPLDWANMSDSDFNKYKRLLGKKSLREQLLMHAKQMGRNS